MKNRLATLTAAIAIGAAGTAPQDADAGRFGRQPGAEIMELTDAQVAESVLKHCEMKEGEQVTPQMLMDDAGDVKMKAKESLEMSKTDLAVLKHETAVQRKAIVFGELRRTLEAAKTTRSNIHSNTNMNDNEAVRTAREQLAALGEDIREMETALTTVYRNGKVVEVEIDESEAIMQKTAAAINGALRYKFDCTLIVRSVVEVGKIPGPHDTFNAYRPRTKEPKDSAESPAKKEASTTSPVSHADDPREEAVLFIRDLSTVSNAIDEIAAEIVVAERAHTVYIAELANRY